MRASGPVLRKASRLAAALFFSALAGVSTAAPTLSSPDPSHAFREGDAVSITVANPPAGASEWEAFVSLDGGRTFPLRVTPHLPIAEASFRWTVPAVPSSEVRVKARFGVRGVEQEFVFAGTFSIAPGGSDGTISSTRGLPGLSPAPGEEGTVAWIEGGVNGARLVVPLSPSGMEPASRWRAAAPAASPSPRRRDVFVPPASPRVREEARSTPLSPPPPPEGRTIASLSRLNV